MLMPGSLGLFLGIAGSAKRAPKTSKHRADKSKHVPKNPEPEILDPEPAYNDQNLSPQEFLVAIMRDKRLPISVRIEAASKVSVYIHPRLAQVTQDVTAGMTIRIEGGLPALPGTNIIMPNHEKPERPKPPVKGNGHDPSSS
jgi:hypothetical protein